MQIFNIKVQLAYILSMIQMLRKAHVVSPLPQSSQIPPIMKNPKENPESLALCLHY